MAGALKTIVVDDGLVQSGTGGLIGTSDMTTTGVTPGTYGDATHTPQFAVDAAGRITSVSDVGITGAGGGGGGDVDSVGLVLPASTFDVTITPITTTGDLTAIFIDQAANTFLRGPTSGGDDTPDWGPLVAADIPDLDIGIITTGILGVDLGGTGADLSAAGGTSQFVRQSTVGGDFTVSAIAPADLPVFPTGTPGAVPDPGTPTGTRVLLDNGTWAVPPPISILSGENYVADATTAISGTTRAHCSVTLPSAGVYWLEADTHCEITTTTSGRGRIIAQLKDLTGDVIIPDSERTVCTSHSSVASGDGEGYGSFSKLFQCYGSTEVDIVFTLGGHATVGNILSDGTGRTCLRYEKLSGEVATSGWYFGSWFGSAWFPGSWFPKN